MVTRTPRGRSLALEVQADLAERPDGLPALRAYAFTSGGRLIASEALNASGATRLPIPTRSEPDTMRLLIGPELEGEEPDAGELLRRGAFEERVALRPNVERLNPLHVRLGAPDVARLMLRSCLVRGKLVKRVGSGGVTLTLPVRGATIDIYEVDPWHLILPKIPDLQISRLREVIDGPWPPEEMVLPPITANPADAIHPSAFLGVAGAQVETRANAGWDLGAPMAAKSPALATGVSMAQALGLPADLKLASRASRPMFEAAVLKHIELLRPLLCWLYPMHVTKQKIATTTTDDCGHFQQTIWRSLFDFDQPDLYFVARQRVFGNFWVTLYEPTPVGCYTWWNYACGTEVTLTTTNFWAHTGPPCPPVIAPNNWVLFMAIGNTSVSLIDHTTGLLDGTRPWGGTLRPRIEFDQSLRADLNVHYYRVSSKRATEDETKWRPSSEAVNRHYTHEVAGDLILEQYALGPKTVGASAHLYEIPPALPPIGQWSIPNAVLDTQSAVIPTNVAGVAPGVGFDAAGAPLGPDEGGLWQIKVELFDASGALVDPEALGIVWRIPESGDLSGTIDTDDAAAHGLVDAARNRMVLNVYLDNNPIFGQIPAPLLDGAPAGDECGVLNYGGPGETVTMPFVAVQRNGFAGYAFEVSRGVPSNLRVTTSGTAANSVAAMPAAPTASVGQLLEDCPVAGFSEHLVVTHSGTDGWSSPVVPRVDMAAAFVLAP
mgnify:CR=1 FL=1